MYRSNIGAGFKRIAETFQERERVNRHHLKATDNFKKCSEFCATFNHEVLIVGDALTNNFCSLAFPTKMHSEQADI
jgi:hypothetical protein